MRNSASEAHFHCVYTEIEHENTNRTVHLAVTKLYTIFRQPPSTIYGNSIKHGEHKTDVTRMEALLLYGGMYADSDILALRNLDQLLQHSVTMARESQYAISNAVIFSEAHAPHFYLWHLAYRTFQATEWGEHSVIGNHKVWAMCPQHVHVEETSLLTPSLHEAHRLYKDNMNLSLSYTVHLWWREHREFVAEPRSVRSSKCLAARLLNNIYLGQCEVCG